MAKLQKQAVTLEAIRAALRSAADDFLRRVAKAHPGESVYGFLLEISCEGFSVHGTVGTEEALTRFAQRRIDESQGDNLAEVKAEYRWGSPEDAWYQQPDKAFDAVNKLLSQAEEQKLYEMYDGSLEALCIEVLKDLDQEGKFGTGTDRERVVLGLCYIGGDNTEKEFLTWAKQVNPPKVLKRLRQELKGNRSELNAVVPPQNRGTAKASPMPSPKGERQLYRLNPGYDQRGNSPWHYLEGNVPQELYFAFFSDRPLAADWQPLTARLARERKQGDFFMLSSLFAATQPGVEVIRGLLGDKVEALPIQLKGKKTEVPPLFLLHPLEVVDLAQHAEIERLDDGSILDVEKFAFERAAIAGKHFFSARGNSGTFIVSAEFRAAIEQSGLKGLGFGPLRGYSY